MKTLKKSALILLAGLTIATAGTQIASARGGWHGGPGPCWDGGAYSDKFTPEVQAMVEKSRAEMAPLHMELRAKQAELTSKIYQGADDGIIQRLTKEISDLQARLTQGHVAIQKQLASAGVPLESGCFMGGFGSHGPGKHLGKGWRGHGPGPDGFGPGYDGKRPPAPKGDRGPQ